MAMDEVMVSALNDLPEGDHKVFALDTIEVGIFRLGDQVLAYENVCPHAGGPVCQGKIFQSRRRGAHPGEEERGFTVFRAAARSLPMAWIRVRRRDRLPPRR